jgi:nitrogen fixation protein FixH
MTASTKHEGFTGRHMLFVMIGFFLTVFAANMSMVYFATTSWTGLVVANSYVASQEFNTTTEKLISAAAQIHSKLNYSDGELVVTLATPEGKTVHVKQLMAHLGRPSHASEDQDVVLLPRGDGNYVAPVRLGKGQWSGTVSAAVQGHQSWTHPVRFIVKE